MSILDPIRTYSAPLTLVLVIFGPQLLNRILSYLSRRNRPQATKLPLSPSVGLSVRLKVFLALHTFYHLSQLLIPPYDLFSTPHLPILAPNDLLRSRLSPSSLLSSALSRTSPLVDLLLSRLQNLDNRVLYLRFGHRALQDCLWCATPLDYLIASLPDLLARYVWAAGVMMLLGSSAFAGESAELSGKRWGRAGIWTVAIMCLAEVGVRYLWDMRITNGDTLHLAHTIHLARTTVLLLLPLLHSFLPPAPTPPNPAVLLNFIQNAQNTSRLSSLLREAVQNDDRLSQIWSIGNSHQAAMTKAAHADPEVKQAILDYRVGDTPADHARAWVEEGWSGLVHSTNQSSIDRHAT